VTELSLFDRGLHYGDGLFETIAVDAGQPLCWSAHWQRLHRGADRLNIPLPDYATLTAEVQTQARALHYGVLKLLVTRGVGGRGYAPPLEAHPVWHCLSYPWPAYPASHWLQGVVVRVCDLRLAVQPALAGIKHLNRLEQVLARQEWHTPRIQEGIVLDSAGYVREGTMSNIFWCRGQDLFTPELTTCGVAGVIRDLLIQYAPTWGYRVHVGDYPLTELATAEAVFLTNSVIGLWPVRQVQQWRYPLGSVVRALQDQLRAQAWMMRDVEIARNYTA